MNDELIRNELLDDPANLGYGIHIETQDWDTIVGLLVTNTTTKPRQFISKGSFLLGIAQSAFRIAQLSANDQTAWDRVLRMIQSTDSIDLTNPNVSALLSVGVLQGVVTQAEVDSLTTEPCSRIEKVLGSFVPITAEQIASIME